MNTITIEGKEYPCKMTMGAMLEFKERTKLEVTDIVGTELSLIIKLMFCCAVSSCRASGVELPYKNEMEMADHMVPDDLTAFQNENFQHVVEGEPEMALEKKKE